MTCPDCGGPMGQSTYTDYCEDDCGWEGQYYDGPDSTPSPPDDKGGQDASQGVSGSRGPSTLLALQDAHRGPQRQATGCTMGARGVHALDCTSTLP
jgi:hypothetical protein